MPSRTADCHVRYYQKKKKEKRIQNSSIEKENLFILTENMPLLSCGRKLWQSIQNSTNTGQYFSESLFLFQRKILQIFLHRNTVVLNFRSNFQFKNIGQTGLSEN